MKIGIFGDSFAAITSRNHKIYKDHPILDNIGKPWPILLKEKYTTVDNFSQAGSDIYFSYKNFLENYKKYDKNIFVVTSSGRKSIFKNDSWLHFPNRLLAERINDRSEGIEKYISSAAIEWFRYILDYKREDFFHKLIVNKINKLDNNCMIIHSFDNYNSLGLINIYKMENKSWNTNIFPGDRKNIDLRHCHMTKENNEIMSNIISQCIENSQEFKLNFSDFLEPKLEDFKNYVLSVQEGKEWQRKK